MNKTISYNILVIISLISLMPYEVSGIATLPDYDFNRHVNDLQTNNFSLENLTTLGAAPYTDIFGSVFWGILFTVLFVIMWISTEDITIPAIVGMLIGASIWGLMPGEWTQAAMSLTVVSFAGIIYSILKRG